MILHFLSKQLLKISKQVKRSNYRVDTTIKLKID